MKLSELNPNTRRIIHEVLLELHRRPVKPNDRSQHVRLGTRSNIIINPDLRDVENNIGNSHPNFYHQFPARRFYGGKNTQSDFKVTE